mgnify:CR=1 FL=1
MLPTSELLVAVLDISYPRLVHMVSELLRQLDPKLVLKQLTISFLIRRQSLTKLRSVKTEALHFSTKRVAPLQSNSSKSEVRFNLSNKIPAQPRETDQQAMVDRHLVPSYREPR